MATATANDNTKKYPIKAQVTNSSETYLIHYYQSDHDENIGELISSISEILSENYEVSGNINEKYFEVPHNVENKIYFLNFIQDLSFDDINKEKFINLLKSQWILEKQKNLDSKLNDLSQLDENWDSYGAQPPNSECISIAKEYLEKFRGRYELPMDVIPHVEGGISMIFSKDDAYVSFDIYNDGDIIAGFSNSEVYEIPDALSFDDLITRMREYLG